MSGLAEAVSQAIASMSEKLKGGEVKPSVAEFTRLLELQRQLLDDNVRHIKVTWIDSLSEMEFTTEI